MTAFWEIIAVWGLDFYDFVDCPSLYLDFDNVEDRMEPWRFLSLIHGY